jgi:hypothetical protein
MAGIGNFLKQIADCTAPRRARSVRHGLARQAPPIGVRGSTRAARKAQQVTRHSAKGRHPTFARRLTGLDPTGALRLANLRVLGIEVFEKLLTASGGVGSPVRAARCPRPSEPPSVVVQTGPPLRDWPAGAVTSEFLM